MKEQGATQNIWGGMQEVAGSFLQGQMSKDRAAEVDKIYGRPTDNAPLTQDGIDSIYSAQPKLKLDYTFDSFYKNRY
jgi:hypothetical protein